MTSWAALLELWLVEEVLDWDRLLADLVIWLELQDFLLSKVDQGDSLGEADTCPFGIFTLQYT
jgi:hypothetical protein